MERRSSNCPPIVEPNQLGCGWNFSCMLHHHSHSLPNQKLLTDESHGNKTLTGSMNTRSQVRILGFDEQVKGINIEPKRKDTMVGSRERSEKKFSEADTSSSKHMMKQQKEVRRDSSQISMDIHSYDEGFCSQIPRKNERGSKLGKTKKHGQLAEKSMQLVQMSEERLLERLLKRNCSSFQSRQFSDALEILKSNKETFLKLLHDPDSLLGKHTQSLQDCQSEEDTVTVPQETSLEWKFEKPVYSMEVWKKNAEKSFWKKIKSRYEHPPNEKKNSRPVDRIVVLKPGQQTQQIPVDTGCFYLQPHHGSTSKQQIIKPTHFSFSNFTKKLKNARKQKKTKDEDENRTSSEVVEVKGRERGKELRHKVGDGESASETSNLSVVPYSKHQDLDIFVEARRRLAERLKQVAKGEASSSKQAPRTLERVLLSSPKHYLMATLSPKRDGTHESFSFCDNSLVGSEKSLHTLKEDKWSGSSPLKQNDDSSSSCCMKIKDEDDFRCVEGSRMGFSLDVSSPTAESMCTFENMDNDRYRGENPSPVSVLESLFIDNDNSPTSTSESVEHQMHPRRLDFEEQSQTSSPPHPKPSSSACMEDRGFISAYVNTVYQASQRNWEEFLMEECHKESSSDHKLLYDCIKEVLIDLHQCYFECSPWITFLKSQSQLVSFDANVVNEVMEKVDRHMSRPTVPRTLDQLVGKDIAKSREWVDIKAGTQEIVIEVVDEALERLITEAILDIHS